MLASSSWVPSAVYTAPATGIEEAVILEDFNGGYYGGNGISVLFKYGCSCLERCSERLAVGALRFLPKGPQCRNVRPRRGWRWTKPAAQVELGRGMCSASEF